jgi:hypothetical protein
VGYARRRRLETLTPTGPFIARFAGRSASLPLHSTPATSFIRTMLTGELRSQIDRIWDSFWSGGISNPMEVLEQITYLLFMRRRVAAIDGLFASFQHRAFRGEL